MTVAEPIAFHQCLSCGAIDAACIDTCAKCLDTNMARIEVAGTGTLASWTTIRKPPLRFKADGVYHVAVVDLDSGIRVTGRLLHEEGDLIGERVIAVPCAADSHASPTFRVWRDA